MLRKPYIKREVVVACYEHADGSYNVKLGDMMYYPKWKSWKRVHDLLVQTGCTRRSGDLGGCRYVVYYVGKRGWVC